MQTLAVPSTEIVADLCFPPAGGSQHLCVVRHSGSQHLPSPYLLEWQHLNRTVLAAAFVKDAAVTLPILLPEPHHRLRLPPLTLPQLKPQIAKSQDGQVMGMLLTIPGLYSRANQILLNTLNRNAGYDYRREVAGMQEEAQRLLASALQRGMLRVRERPGVMAHAVSFSELAPDEVCISRAFAERLYPELHQRLPGLVRHVWQLDGLPVWATRFPVGNEFGIQEKFLRIVEGTGRYLGFNPWDLGKRYLGDNDGDSGFFWVRCDDLLDGKVEAARRPRLALQHQVKKIENCLTLQTLLHPESLLPAESKAAKLLQPDMHTIEDRLGFIQDCDSRTFVAIFTLVFLWWCPRVLVTKGALDPWEAYQRCARAAEWFLEASFDGRKEGSPFMQPGFDIYDFLNLLMQGEDPRHPLDFGLLLRIGAPEEAVETLRLAWTVTDGDLRAACAASPVYDALVLRRRQMNDSIGDLLRSLQAQGVTPDDLYQKIRDDLQGRAVLGGNLKRGAAGDDGFDEEDE